jgi:GMP synthase (glutamine-hydrolysing)
VLVVEHEADDPVALFGTWMREVGADLDESRPWAGDVLPPDLGDHDALLVMGGWMSAHHDAEIQWLTGVKDLVRQAARDGVPTLGICLGHQVAAVALGGTVVTNPAGRQMGLLEVGWCDAAAGDPLVGTVATPRRGIHWNSDIASELPAGAELLARAPGGEIQAARFAPSVWGVQWHPEIDAELLQRWVDDDPSTRGREADQAEVTRAAAARAELDAAWQPLAAAFVELAAAYAQGVRAEVSGAS